MAFAVANPQDEQYGELNFIVEEMLQIRSKRMRPPFVAGYDTSSTA